MSAGGRVMSSAWRAHTAAHHPPRAALQRVPVHAIRPSAHSQRARTYRTGLACQVHSRHAEVTPLASSGGSNPPRDPPSTRPVTQGPDEDPQEGSGHTSQGRLLWRAVAAVLAAIAVSVLRPRPAAAASPSGPGADDLDNDPDATKVPPPREGTTAAIKRLLREVFADLIVIKGQIEELQPKSEEDDVSIPHEGGSVQPVTHHVAQDVRYKAKANVSGQLTYGAPLATVGQESTSGQDVLLASSAPHMTVLVQSMWKDRTRTLTARLTNVHNAALSSAPGLGPQLSTSGHTVPTHSSQLVNKESPLSTQLSLESLLLRGEVWGGRVKVCVAPRGGALSSIARRLNPTASVPRLTQVASQGHGISAVTERGAGVAATWVARPASKTDRNGQDKGTPDREGVLSASVGRFNSSGTDGAPVAHTLGQLSLHTLHHGCISLLLSAVSPLSPPVMPARGPAPTTSAVTDPSSTDPSKHEWQASLMDIHAMETDTQPGGTGAAGSGAAAEAGARARRRPADLRAGVCGCATVSDWFTVAGWGAADVRQGMGNDAAATGRARGFSAGAQMCTLPDARGTSLAATWAVTGQASDVPRGAEKGLQGRLAHVGELSVHVPLADGASVTPGVVLVKEGSQPVGLHVGCRSDWRF